MSSAAASSSSARDDVAASSSASPRSDALGLVNSTSGRHTNMASTHRSTSSRMARTINTIPAWARHDPPSPPATPTRSRSPNDHQRKPSGSTTWPKAPKPAFLQASPPQVSRELDEHRPVSSSSSSSEEEAGPSRFWSFTLPARMRGGGGAMGGAATTKRKETADDSSSQGDAEQHVGRRQSFTNTLTATLTDAFTNLASSTYIGGRGGGRRQSSSLSGGEEKQTAEQGDAEPWTQDSEPTANGKTDAKQAGRGVVPDSSFSRHQPLTPGWESPWRPESRGGQSIEFGKYRFNNHGEGGYFPRTETNRSNGSRKKRKVGMNGMTIIHGKEKSGAGPWATVEWWKHFLLHNPFVPLLFRVINVAFTAATLAIAIKLHLLLKSEGAQAAVGSSPIVAIVFAPLTLLHVGIQIWLEYFSRPIGLWQVGSKLFYTLIELIFVCLWSAELSLSFDNYFTSTLVCTPFNSPYANQTNGSLPGGSQILPDPSRKPLICRLQGALIGLVFTSLLAYVVVLTVSLFRIFVRVSRR